MIEINLLARPAGCRVNFISDVRDPAPIRHPFAWRVKFACCWADVHSVSAAAPPFLSLPERSGTRRCLVGRRGGARRRVGMALSYPVTDFRQTIPYLVAVSYGDPR